jgi:hypothetical protein
MRWPNVEKRVDGIVDCENTSVCGIIAGPMLAVFVIKNVQLILGWANCTRQTVAFELEQPFGYVGPTVIAERDGIT